VDYSRPFAASDHTVWAEQYTACVRPELPMFLEELAPSADRRQKRDPLAPFGADADMLDWWPDLFDEMPLDTEIPHGNHA
jgi:hypothetical protein